MLALALVLGAASNCLAQTWVGIGSDTAGNAFELDQDSIRTRGALVDAWIRVKLKAPAKDNFSGKYYLTGVTERLENCAQKLTATIAYSYYDDRGTVTSTYNVPEPAWQFISAAPGSVGEQFQARICGMARANRGPPPAPPVVAGPPGRSLKIGPGMAVKWTPLALDKDGSQVFAMEGGVYRLKDHLVGYIQKVVRTKPAEQEGGPPYVTAYSAVYIDCMAKTYGVGSPDFYGENGALVTSIPVRDVSKIEMAPIPPKSIMDLAQQEVCRPGVAKAPPEDRGGGDGDDDGAIYTGTGWLGPKGYLITAAHVIEGMDHLVLAQGGREVGVAEVVLADPANDVAVLKPKFRDGIHPAMAMSLQPALLGERVFTLGYPAPDQLGLSLKMTSGEVSALTGRDVQSQRLDDARLIQISVPIQSGNSGGPVIADDGRVVGIVISRMERVGEDETAQNANYALKITYVRALLAELPDIGGYRPTHLEPSRAAAVAELQSAVFLIVGSKDPPEKGR